jgi:DNA-binding SARP family transcriptional activator
VKILALAAGHRLHREQVMDMLWPDELPEVAAPKLHKAAHFARRATGRDDTIVLRSDVVHLFPGATITTDVAAFERTSARAIADRDPATARAAIEIYSGELLPEDRYEEWAGERRELLRLRHLQLLRIARQWVELIGHDPSDEYAHVELMREFGGCDDGGCEPGEGQVEQLLAELAELNRRQAQLLELLCAAGPSTAPLAALGARP